MAILNKNTEIIQLFLNNKNVDLKENYQTLFCEKRIKDIFFMKLNSSNYIFHY